ncbi:DNA cytosine methyltransferase [Saccharothrix sp. 6-C]|uniref:DNA cytosine methyltransferase n=1 Tax=Saccharothrix sp. 6-C TaxID=2781735 RepID=UPI0019175410|nr:DNA cytosine methyltransferase [Saccharothrix sp. 6-C]QQQ76351.1 DNA cytosine methyltransferase [Saccharothrix sp. 6-C]
MTVAVVDFFSGCGGTSLGFREAGMSIVAGIDNDPDAASTYRANFPEAHFFERDIRTLTVKEVKKILPKRTPILFSGCAPCQPFSAQNRSVSQDDPRRFLLSEFQRFILALTPDFVVVENVPGLQKVGDTGPFNSFVQALESHGYDVACKVLSALDYGVPQMRKRLVLVAARGTMALIPQPTHGPGSGRKAATFRDWASGLPYLEAGETDPNDPDHAAMSLSAINLKRILATAEGKGRETWGEDLLLDCHRGHSGHSDVYGRLAWDRPASAMTTRCLSYSNGRYGHPDQPRAISLREAACLQTFPRDFKFHGTLTSKGRQVGNAVPPLLAQRIGETIISSLPVRRRGSRARSQARAA